MTFTLIRPYTESGIDTGEDVSKIFMQARGDVPLMILESSKTCGVMLVDAAHMLRSMTKPMFYRMENDISKIDFAVAVASDTELFPVKLAPMGLKHFICVASKANVPQWSIGTRKLLEPRLLRAAGFDAKGMIEPTMYAVPMMIAFKFAKLFIDNKDIQDEVIQDLVKTEYGQAASEWVKEVAYAIAEGNWKGFFDVYDAIVNIDNGMQ